MAPSTTQKSLSLQLKSTVNSLREKQCVAVLIIHTVDETQICALLTYKACHLHLEPNITEADLGDRPTVTGFRRTLLCKLSSWFTLYTLHLFTRCKFPHVKTVFHYTNHTFSHTNFNKPGWRETIVEICTAGQPLWLLLSTEIQPPT